MARAYRLGESEQSKKMLFRFREYVDHTPSECGVRTFQILAVPYPRRTLRTATYATLLVILASAGSIFGETLEQQARDTLRAGLNQRSTAKRTQAVRVLGLLPCDSEAAEMAQTALQDHRSEVRAAAAIALGQMASKEAIPELKKALLDRKPAVVLAAAHALWVLNDPAGYEVYYELLTGERESGEHFVAEQMETVKDRKKMAELGFEEGLGVVPFAGIGLGAVKTIHKNDASPVRASAASSLVNDKDPRVSKALVRAISDKSWAVRASALAAIAKRNDSSTLNAIAPALSDKNQVVRFTAAATMIRLTIFAAQEKDCKAPNNVLGTDGSGEYEFTR